MQAFRVLLPAFFLLINTWVLVGQNRLSDAAEISIVTIGPYQPELYSVFGHIGIRVYDPANNINHAFHYGVFDFEQKNFYVNFVKGSPYYMLGIADYERFKNKFIRENRIVIEQKLNLTQPQKQAYYSFLVNNYRPENRNYVYHYVYNNCATKIPEITDQIFDRNVKYDTSYVIPDKTIRELMNDHMDRKPWGRLGINICLGSQIDEVADTKTYMFLPFKVKHAFENATFQSDSVSKPLISETKEIFIPTTDSYKAPVITPFLVFSLLLILIILSTSTELKNKKRRGWIDMVLFSIIGIAGWLLVFLWFGTYHMSKYNWNLLWALPVHLPLVFLARGKWNWVNRFYLQSALVCVLLMAFMPIIPQRIPPELIPLIIALSVRGFVIWRLG